MKSLGRKLAGLTLLYPILTVSLTAQVLSFSEITGHEFGSRITVHAEMARYLKYLHDASPRVVVEVQGRSWEGRELMLAIVTSPENHQRLNEIRATARRLGDPRLTTPEQARQLIESQPAILWFGGSIHGFELSGSEGILKVLERLTTSDDPATLAVLRNAVVLIDPMLNPDGRDAFANLNHQNLGASPNPRREDWANDFTFWEALKFRTGHYYFDTNRDWFAHTQRETQARVPTLVSWRPQLVVDMHEMGSDVEFYFDPATDPYPPFFPDFARQWFEIFNEAYAAAFDSAGFEFMTRERYNYFYPGYTTSFGSYQGAVGMLYEQGSTRGLVIERPDQSVRTLADALEQQYLAAWTAMRTSAARKDDLLRNYYDAHREAVADGGTGARRYLVTPDGDPELRGHLVRMLLTSGVEVEELTSGVRLSGVTDREGRSVGQRDFPAGTVVIEAAQPRNRLIRTLLEPENELPPEFLERARERVERGVNPRFYDITAWSLPLLLDLGGYSSTDARDLPTRALGKEERDLEFPETPPRYAYLIDGAQAGAVSALYHLKEQGFRAAMIYHGTSIGGREFSSGTVIVRLGQNPETVHSALGEIARRAKVDVAGVNTGLATGDAPSLGSGDWVITVDQPRIALLAENPISAYSFGWAWYTLDQQYGIPTTVVRVRSVANTPLDRFNVLVIPSVSGAGLAREIGEDGVERLKSWVRDGGTLVTLGGAAEFAREQLELVSLRSWYDLEENENAQRFNEPGAFIRGMVNHDHWLTAGYESDEVPVLYTSSRIYLPPEGPPSSRRRMAVRFAEGETALMTGHIWPETRERLPGSVLAYEERAGRGRVIVFSEDINFRAYWRGLNRMFLNAVVVGPSAP